MYELNHLSTLLDNAQTRRKVAEDVSPYAEQRTQDLHEQQLRFQEDEHKLKMQQLFQKLDQGDQAFSLSQEHSQQKQNEGQVAQQDQAQQRQVRAQQQQDAQQNQAAQQQHQQRANMMGKAAQIQALGLQKLSMTFNEYGQPVPESSALPPTLLGGAMGGAGAHLLMPTEDTQRYRDLAGEITPAQSQESWRAAKAGKVPRDLMDTVADTAHTGTKVKFKAPAHVRKRYFADRALQSNAKRLVGATGGGLLAGYLLHSALQPDV